MDKEADKKYYQVIAAIIDLTHHTIVASSKIGIVSQGLNYQPTLPRVSHFRTQFLASKSHLATLREQTD